MLFLPFPLKRSVKCIFFKHCVMFAQILFALKDGPLNSCVIRDDTNMASMKIVQFPRRPPPLLSYVQNSSTPLTLDVQFETNLSPLPPSPNENQSIKRKHNPRIAIICYQVFPSCRLSFSVSAH